MTSGLRYVAPAGAPVSGADLMRWAALRASRRDASGLLRDEIAKRFGVKHAFLTSTGRAGLTILLRAVRSLVPSDKCDVVLPSYTCFSVAAAVVKAGLRPRIVDIDPATLDYDDSSLAAVDFTRVIAIIATNLYGLPNNLPALSALAQRHKVFLIDDAAQAMGAEVGGRSSGSWGDAGLFSLDKGKNVSAIDGGIVVTNSNDVAAAVAREMHHLPLPPARDVATGVVKAVAYSLMLRPRLYWIPNRLPQLGLGRTVFTTDFALEQPIPALTSLAVVMLKHLDEFTTARTRNAAALLKGLHRIPGIRTITPLPGTVPVYLRLPILIADANARRRALDDLRAAGIGATGSYPASLVDVPELQHRASIGSTPAGRAVAEQIVTLPTHAFVSPVDIERTIELLASAMRGVSALPALAVSA